MGKVPVRLREVVYTLSPFEQSVMSGLWKDLPHKASHHAKTVSGRRGGRGQMASQVQESLASVVGPATYWAQQLSNSLRCRRGTPSCSVCCRSGALRPTARQAERTGAPVIASSHVDVATHDAGEPLLACALTPSAPVQPYRTTRRRRSCTTGFKRRAVHLCISLAVTSA